MGYNWRHIPALLAGAAILAATLQILGVPSGGQSSGAAQQLPAATVGQSGRAAQQLPATAVGQMADRPSETLVRALERTARGLIPVPYFVDSNAADRFLAHWEDQLVEGKAQVESADDLDAGAIHGHVVPVTLWLDGGSRVMGLTGTVGFEPTGNGPRIRQLDLRTLPLAIPTWERATRRLRQAGHREGPVFRGVAPFFGRFHFSLGGQRYAVDARTGEVTTE